VQAWEVVARARAPDGAELTLSRRGAEWAVRAAGRALMSSRAHRSVEALAELALARVAPGPARAVLVGGLGLGYTLRAALDRLPATARVTVAELVPALAEWNRGPLADLAGRPLEDRRVEVRLADVAYLIGAPGSAYDAILLDVDNGPSALAHPRNGRLYGERGVAACREALRIGGVLAVWSAGPDAGYLARLARAGLEAEVRTVTDRDGGGRRHALFLARRSAGAPTRRRKVPP
jgi:spermidine synthase